jgi:hypothetical protein
MPTKIRPRCFSAGPMASQISRSRGQLGFSGRPPTCMLARASPSGRHPVDGAGGLAVDQDDALVALAHLRQVALHDDRLAVELVNISSSALRFSSSGPMWNTPAPPLPNSGLTMMSPCSRGRPRSRAVG